MKTRLLLVTAAILPLFAYATPYRQSLGPSQLRLRSAQGLNIVLESQNYASGEQGDTETNTAEQIEIVANGGPATMNSRIQAVLIPNCRDERSGEAIAQPTLTLNLTPQTDGSSLDFAGTFNGTVMLSFAVHGGDDGTACQPQLAIVVDGNWQTDPVNGTHNFVLTNL